MSSIGSAIGSGSTPGGANLASRTIPQQFCGSVDSRTSCASSLMERTCSAMCDKCFSLGMSAGECALVATVVIATHLETVEMHDGCTAWHMAPLLWGLVICHCIRQGHGQQC